MRQRVRPHPMGAIGMPAVITPAVVALALLSAAPAAAQSACASTAGNATVRVVERRWPAPLDRQVTLEGRNVTLRDGLARLATAARVRLSYVAELLPLDRPSCLTYRAVPAGQVLAELLRGTELEPVVAGDDQVVLAPARRGAVAPPNDDGGMARRPSVLDRVVITGVSGAAPERSLPIAADVVSGRQLARQETSSLSRMLGGSVPGLWMWEQSPTTLAARYGSVRGASSFGLSYLKIYIDGIEVANPLLLTHLDPQTIERIDVIRGPQGAALYGADAMSGVINITTRHDGAGPAGRRLRLESTAGVSGSAFAPQGVLTQAHALAFRTGSSERSGGLGVQLGSLGAYVPGAFARTLSANGDLRIVGARSVLTGTARWFSENAGAPANPLLRGGGGGAPDASVSRQSRPSEGPSTYASWGTDGGRPAPLGAPTISRVPGDSAATQSVRQYTVGGSLSFMPNDRWTHAVVLGIDGYRLDNAGIDDGPIPSAADSALDAARGGADRGTARLTSTARFGSVDGASTALTFTAEHSVVRERSTIVTTTVGGGGFGRLGGPAVSGEARLTGWRGNSGLVAQVNTALRNTLFLTAGVRLERDAALVGTTRTTTLPMLGGAIVRDRGDVTVKLRAAYGKAIRPVQGAIRELAWGGRRAALVAYDLAPEEQSGVEAGADLFVGRTFGLHVTRFDQTASGLIQSVAVSARYPASSQGLQPDGAPASGSVAYQLQNVGEIGNHGWEMQGTVDLGRLSLASTLSLVDSRVRRVASAYGGDLRAGDRMLDVPARTVSLTGSWTTARWVGSLTVARAANWMGYDRLALAEALTSGGVAPADLVGDQLRSYWRSYGGVTRVRATFTRDIFRGLSLVMTGDNLLGQQRGEPDNVTVVPGRTVTAGLKAKF